MSFVSTSIRPLQTAGGEVGTETWKETFGYDRYGNRETCVKTVNGFVTYDNPGNGSAPTCAPEVDKATNRFSDNKSFTYDPNGNLVQDEGDNGQVRNFTFNGDNKQTEIRDANNNLIGRYFYDGEGKRVKKQSDTTGELTVFVYDGFGKLVAEYTNQTASQAAGTNYVATDTLQSVRAITDQNGNVTARRDFMPFGEEIYSGVGGRTGDNGQKYSSSADTIRQKFTGYQNDKETGLDFAEARMYENRYGRFTAVDPLLASGKSANPQSFNRYAYGFNNPIMNTDPTGLQVASCTRCNWYTNNNGTFSDQQEKGFDPVKGTQTHDATDGYSYTFTANSITNLGLTSEINRRAENFAANYGFADATADTAVGTLKWGWNGAATVSDGFYWATSRFNLQYFSTGQPTSRPEVKYFEPSNQTQVNAGIAMTGVTIFSGGFTSFRNSASVAPRSSTLAGFGSDAAIAENSANLIPKKGWYDAVVHGTRDGQNFTINGRVTSPNAFYEVMLQNGYQPGTNIRLMSCFAGSCANGAAQQLSNLAGAKVVAPAGAVHVGGGGGVFTRGVPYVSDGKWFRVFRPQ